MDEYLTREYCLSCVDNFLHKTGMPIAAQYFYDCFKEIEAANVQPVKRGKWDFQGYQLFRCTNCKKIYTQEQLEDIGENWAFPNFCPNCGAKMSNE